MKGVVLRTLGSIDWDFALPRSGYVAPPHWYPGSFIPALSDALIEALTPKGGTIFDPYGGGGTAGWSAMRTARSCHIADANPIAILATYVTTSLLTLARADRFQADLALVALSRTTGRNDDLFGNDSSFDIRHLDAIAASYSSPSPSTVLAQTMAGPPNWEALSNWIAEETLADMERLLGDIFRSNSIYVRLLGLCMASAIARVVSSQHASWGHIADNVRPRELQVRNVHEATHRWLSRTRAFVGQPMAAPNGGPKATMHIHRRDWSLPNQPGPPVADLLLTSPPYADAIDYTLAQRLSLYLLGYDDDAIQSLVAGEIGARRKRFKSTSRSKWSEQLCAALSDQLTWLKPGGVVCLVLPHKDSGRSVGEIDLKAALERLGWRLFFERDRSIHQSHARQSWTSIKKETILAFSSDCARSA